MEYVAEGYGAETGYVCSKVLGSVCLSGRMSKLKLKMRMDWKGVEEGLLYTYLPTHI